jgi:excinuclease ABC subunit C
MSVTFDPWSFLKTTPHLPGVYTMKDEVGVIIYVGKAKNLQKRLSSYFQKNHPDLKTRTLVTHIQSIDLIITATEKEALLLENNLIKHHKPRYNILFKDDKTYPFVVLTTHKQFPRLEGVRARVLKQGQYFGPYPSMLAVRDTITLLQKIFKIRSCEDAVFHNRTRPCLLYQIKRCSGPCVNLIDEAAYARDVSHVRLFLEGKSQEVFKNLIAQMDQAAVNLQFEQAAILRDQIKTLRSLQESQFVDTRGHDHLDVIAVAQEGQVYCIQVLQIRDGRVLGSRDEYAKGQAWDDEISILSSFLEHFYGSEPHPQLVTRQAITWGEEHEATQQARGKRKRWLDLCQLNARESVLRHILEEGQIQSRLEALRQRLNFAEPLSRIECFDISHTQGEETMASCVVCDAAGMNKKSYRRFKIEGITPGDDYAAMRQVILRRLKRLQEESAAMPDLLIIDGGKGQLKQAVEVLVELGLKIRLIGVAKGPERQSGTEELWQPGQLQPLILDPHDEAFLLIQHIRDEAHRFAIAGHRGRREKKRAQSNLDHLPGIGPKRRAAILKHFGGWQEVKAAGVDELTKVPGISPKLAAEIVQHLQSLL